MGYLLSLREAEARPNYLQEYPARWKDRCDLCHINPMGGGPLNAYGEAFQRAGLKKSALDEEDTDRDGFPNKEEIEKGSSPSDRNSTPVSRVGISGNARGGNAFLLLAFLFTLSQMVFAGVALVVKDTRWLQSALRAFFLFSFSAIAASFFLVWAFLKDDFSLQYVARHSALEMPWYYKLSGFWGGQEGSLLFWLLILTFYGLFSIKSVARGNPSPAFQAIFLFVFSIITAFFVFLLLFVTNPFAVFRTPPAQGAGLNPLLQNPAMLAHPPSLYLGYVGFAIPFILTITALIHGKLDRQWEKSVRMAMLIPWVFQTVGIILGGAWAYVELGWGGYWAWDPVENASLMPWLTATAFLHSLMVQERTRLLKLWNVVLVSLTFLLSVLGTFITRSGLISSVHAFSNTGLGTPFLFFMVVIFLGSFLLITYRWSLFGETSGRRSFFSREGIFLFNNWILLGLMVTVLWGTLYPIFSEWLVGKRLEVGAPFYNQITGPMLWILLVLTGLGPLFRWGETSWAVLKKALQLPLMVSAFGLILLWVYGIHDLPALLGYGGSLFLLSAIGEEFYRGIRARCKLQNESVWKAFQMLFRKNARRYGGFIVHLGVGVMAIGIVASQAFKVEKDVNLRPGESFPFMHHTFRYERLEQKSTPNYVEVRAVLNVSQKGKMRQMYPARRIYAGAAEQSSSETAIWVTFAGDYYLVLSGWTEAEVASFRFTYNPLISWIWIGGILMLLGSILILWFRKE
ncbi:MAG: heme lyase CcmF/NrfE family subunit [bacterium JZ-2024 1]